MSGTASPPTTWSPLRRPVFRSIWIASVVSNTGTWMQDLGASWLMTSLTDRAFLIAMVQVAVTAPVFLLALPAGGLADILDRRRYLLGTYAYLSLVAAVMGLVTLLGLMTATTLLFGTLALGIGIALTQPAFASILPELVARDELQSAVMLNSISLNVSRTVGPAIAGVIIALHGTWLVFVLNAFTFSALLVVILRWRRETTDAALPSERLIGALGAGLRYASASPGLLTVLIRGVAYFVPASAVIALLPIVARQQLDGDAATYGWLLGAMGIGAVAGAVLMPQTRRRLDREDQVRYGTVVVAAVLLLLSQVDRPEIALPVMLVGGVAWVNAVSSLQTAGQLCLPSWVRARGLSLVTMAFMGGIALGAATWGHLADLLDVPTSLMCAAATSLVLLLVTHHRQLQVYEGDELMPAPAWPIPTPVEKVAGDRGPVMVTVEYQIDPTRAREFSRVMREMRRIRLRNGAISWGLFADTGRLGRYLEHFMVLSWIEHVRFSRRITVAERKVMDAAHTFHEEEGGPVTRHFIAQRLPRN